MIHFFDPSNERMAAKVPDIAKQVDVLLGNLEDAIAADKKEAARDGLVAIANATDFGTTQLWTRIQQPRFALGTRRPTHTGARDR